MSLRSRLALTLVCFLLGASLVAQLRGRRGQAPASSVPSKDLSVILGGLVAANADLRNEVHKLEGEIQAYGKASEQTVLPQMVEELGRMRIVNGGVDVVGGGVEISVGPGVGAIDLQDLLNEVRNVGAEAISLNGVRLTTESALAANERGIALDGRQVDPPYLFQATGDPTTMATALNRRGGQLDILRGYYPGLKIEVKAVPRLVLPSARNGKQFVLAQPLK